MMAEVVAQAQKEALPQGASTYHLPFPCSPLLSPFFFFLTINLSVFASTDIGTKGLEPAIAEEAKGLASSAQTTKAQTGIPQTIQRPESPPVPEGGDTIMEEALEMAVSDPSLRLPAFLAHFDSLEFNSFPSSHFHHFGPPFASFL